MSKKTGPVSALLLSNDACKFMTLNLNLLSVNHIFIW